MEINAITPDKQEYLKVLTHIANAPKSLDYIGTLPSERRPSVAIVGTRKPTRYGREVTHQLAYELARKGVVIVSGLALGVDGIAHQAALEARGTTIAVLGCGLPRIYPAAHRDLAQKIVANSGAILSEYERDAIVQGRYSFLERNRIVSGLSDAIIITEAAARSGTLNTAAHALQQGKDIFVVPGNITSPLSAGCNMLIRQGATPITSYEDVLSVIAPAELTDQMQLPLGTTPLETELIKLLSNGMRDGDELLRNAKIDATELNTTLTMMELGGVVRNLGANQWTLR